MRATSTAFLAALIIAALFWGNCLTCPQAISSSAHSCCPHGKKAGSDCRTQVMRHFEKADPHQVETAGMAQAQIAAAAAPGLPLAPEPAADPVSTGHPPPDLLSLHSNFRI
jgi:hypothetical protein